jgi:type VI secretion system protein ImpM
MNTTQELCGLFGKIPHQSDFVTHHLPVSFTEHWHHWLQSSISISREQLEEEWLERYMISPVWYFSMMPGIAHEKSVAGVVIPSVDEIGRHFPLTIAHTGEHDCWAAYLYGEEWYNAIEQIALLALADDVTYTRLIGELEALETPEFSALPNYTTQSAMHAFKSGQVISQSPQQTKQDLALSLLPQAYKQRYGQHSLWWTKGSSTVNPCLAISSNLPDPGQFAAMLDGNWQRWGWTEESIHDNNQNGEE